MSQVRQRLGDTSCERAEVQDETIQAYLTMTSNNVLQTCHKLALDLQAKYARYADVTVDDQLQRFKHIYDNYTKLADRFAREIAALPPSTDGAAGFSPIVVGGLGDCRGPLDNCCDDYGYNAATYRRLQ